MNVYRSHLSKQGAKKYQWAPRVKTKEFIYIIGNKIITPALVGLNF